MRMHYKLHNVSFVQSALYVATMIVHAIMIDNCFFITNMLQPTQTGPVRVTVILIRISHRFTSMLDTSIRNI